MIHKHQLLSKLGLATLAVFGSILLHAQSVSLGNTYIDAGGEMTVVGAHSFANGGSGALPGIVATQREILTAHLSFVTGSSWAGAADNAHVDGYVRSYQTGSFIFPIGDNGNYSPAAVSASSFANPTMAAYFEANPNTAVTSNIKGGNHTALPAGAPFATNSFDGATLKTVSTKEYWDINGATAATISLTWDAFSDIAMLTNSTLLNLTIAGWDGTKWVRIPATVDATSILGGASTLSAGSITTDASVVPSTFTAYALAEKNAGVEVFVKVFLEGPYNTTTHQMNTALSAGGATSILATSALTQPYSTAPWIYAGTETVSPSFFATHTNVVDWVLIELRDKNSSSTILRRRAALVTANGNVIDTNGTAGIFFNNLLADNYFVSVRHRNHLGIMKSATLYLDENPLANDVDFTTTATILYGSSLAAVQVALDVHALHMGNAHYLDNIIKFTGSNNDKAAIGIKVNSSVNLTNTVLGYSYEDIDLSGVTSFTGSGNDKAKLGLKLNTAVNLVSILTEQLP